MGGGSSNPQTQVQEQTDRKISAGGGVTALQDSTVTLADGAQVSFQSADAETTRLALETALGLGENSFDAATTLAQRGLSAASALAESSTSLAQSAFDASERLSANAQEGALEVARSQAKFVEVASGQKTAIYAAVTGLVGIVAVGAVIILGPKKKA